MFHSLRVGRIVEETAEAKSIVLDVPASLAADFRYRAGQFLTFEFEVGGERLRRSYSLASSPDWEGGHKVTVKRVDGGRVSCWINDRLRVGDVVSVTKPEGRFVLDASAGPLVLFAAGSGITPVVSLVKTALKTTSRWVLLFYANRDARSVIFGQELATLEQANPTRLRVVHRLDEVQGFLDEVTVREVAAANPGASFYLCGPTPFMGLVERTLRAASVPEERVHIERFASASAPKSPEEAAAAVAAATPASGAGVPAFIDITLRGEKTQVPYVPGKTLLQTAKDAGLDAPYSCEEGFCGCCASQLLEGAVVMAADDALTTEEKKKGMILACQSRPTTARCGFRFLDS
ncbi:MAG: 2Fe-2S iron-sulfur cluster-binding protein [Polyangiaceae bacterium]